MLNIVVAFQPESGDNAETVLHSAYAAPLLSHNASGVWKGSVQASEKNGKNKRQSPAELALNQNVDALTGTLSFTYPQAGRIQVPITSGVVSKDAVTFSGQQQFPSGASAELTFHGTVKGGSLNGTLDMTSRGLFGTVTNSGPLTLKNQYSRAFGGSHIRPIVQLAVYCSTAARPLSVICQMPSPRFSSQPKRWPR